MRLSILVLVKFLFSYFIGTALCSISISPIYRDGAVIQSGPKTTVWGWTTSSGDITLAIDGKPVGKGKASDKDDPACKQKKWVVEFSTENISDGPHVISVSVNGEKPAEAKDIYFGNVIVCGGQSNMAAGSSDGVLQQSELDPLIRMYGFSMYTELKGCMLDENPPVIYWKADNLELVKNHFSSVCFFAAKSMRKTLGKPVGMIRTAVPGQNIDSFLQGGFVFENVLKHLQDITALGMIHYQGESDASTDRVQQYGDKLKAFISYCRQALKPACGDTIPIGIIQLPGPWKDSDGKAVKMIMETQMKIGSEIPRGFVVESHKFTPDTSDLHPTTGKDKIGLEAGEILSNKFSCGRDK